MPFIKLLAAASTTLAVYGLYKALRFFIRPFFSSFRDLKGPSSPSFVFGNLEQIRRAEALKLHEKWVAEYGKTMKYKAFFGVRPSFNVRLVLTLYWYLERSAVHSGPEDDQPCPHSYHGLPKITASPL